MIYFRVLFFFVVFLFMTDTEAITLKNDIMEEIRSDYDVRALYVENRSLPIVNMRIVFLNSGYAYDPVEKSGLSALVSNLLTQGYGHKDRNAFLDKLSANGIVFSTNADKDNFYIDVKMLSRNVKESTDFILDMLSEIVIKEENIEELKNQLIGTLQHLEADDHYIIHKEISKSIFSDHPYGNTPYGSRNTISKITKEDLIQYFKNRFNRINLQLLFSGDIDKQHVLEIIQHEYFVTLPLTQATKVKIEKFDLDFDNSQDSIFIRKNVQHTHMAFFHKGVSMHDKKYPALFVLMLIVGNGHPSGSILGKEVRGKRGYTYSIKFELKHNKFSDLLQGSTMTDFHYKDVERLIKSTLNNVKNGEISQEDFYSIKRIISNKMLLSFDTNQKIINLISDFYSHNLSPREIFQILEKIDKVTFEEVKEVAAEFLNPDKMVFISISNKNSDK